MTKAVETATNAKPAPTGIDMTKFAEVGENIKTMVLDNVLFVAINIDPTVIAQARPSASGKSKSVASTLGNVAILSVPGLKLGLNAYVPNR